MMQLKLPDGSGRISLYSLSGSPPLPTVVAGPFDRIAYSAADVVADPLASQDPWLDAAIDWDTSQCGNVQGDHRCSLSDTVSRKEV